MDDREAASIILYRDNVVRRRFGLKDGSRFRIDPTEVVLHRFGVGKVFEEIRGG